MRVSVSVDERLLEEIQEKLGEFSRKAPNVLANALNRAATNVNSNIKKEVRKEYVIKSKDIQATLLKSRASRGNLRAMVHSKSGVIPLDKFKVSPKTVNPKRKKSIKIGVKKGSVKTVLGAFVADINGNKVFQRSGDKRLPIKRLFGPSVPQMISNEQIRTKIETKGQETFQQRLDHEINRILDKGRN